MSKEKKIEDGGPAYPTFIEKIDGPQRTVERFNGLTKREWFAGMSMLGRRSNASLSQLFTAEECFADADAMLKASKENQ